MYRKPLALAAALVLVGSGLAQAQESVVLRLPAPTGPHPVGVTTLHLADTGRPDPWDAARPARELMVSVFYPAASTDGYVVAPQMTAGAAAVFGGLDAVHTHPELPDAGVDWAATRTHSYAGAPAQPRRRPVLLYTPGAGDPRTLGTGLAEDLASRGYVVVTVDHPGETTEVEFPTGEVRITAMRSHPGYDPALFDKLLSIRSADIRFVLDSLRSVTRGVNPDVGGRALPASLDRALDLRRVGVYGHSAGGTTAAVALHGNRTVDAAVNLEGFLDGVPSTPGTPGPLLPVAEEGTRKPLLLLSTDGYWNSEWNARFTHSWTAMLDNGCRTTHTRITNATHWVFTDLAQQAPQLQTAGLMTAAEREALIGPIDPETSRPAVHDRVAAFFDRHI